MTGYHEVKVFRWPDDGSTLILPDGWKPFSSTYIDEPFYVDKTHGYHKVVCRKWHRKGQTLADFQAEVDAA